MNLESFIKRNAPMILACLGSIGMVATTVIAVKETPKVLALLKDAEEEKGENLTEFEKIKIAGPIYIPSAITGAATAACIFGSAVISKSQQASLMSAYALLESSYKEYKKKTGELYGDDAGRQIREKIANDSYASSDISLNDDAELFYDFYSARYFESTKEKVFRAQYEINRCILKNHSAGLNEYYDLLGLEQMTEYKEIGWSRRQIETMYHHPWIEFCNEETIVDGDSEHDEDMKCTIVYTPFEPVMNYRDY